jgi:alpha/beta hydrolase fold
MFDLLCTGCQRHYLLGARGVRGLHNLGAGGILLHLTCPHGHTTLVITGNTLQSSDDPSEEAAMTYQEVWVDRNGQWIHARDYPGQEPAIVLMHGFPEDLHLYDQLIPHLNPPRRVITFDFLGWGASDKPARYPVTMGAAVGGPPYRRSS